jgi:hypothetical protein
MEQPASSDLFDLRIDSQTSSYLREAARWAKFLAIVGFVFCGIIVLVAFFAGSVFGYFFERFGNQTNGFFGGAFLTICYLLVALFYFFPCLYLYQFGAKAQTALKNNDHDQMAISFRNLKSLFRFIGILTIVMLSMYALFIIVAIITAGFTSHQVR